MSRLAVTVVVVAGLVFSSASCTSGPRQLEPSTRAFSFPPPSTPTRLPSPAPSPTTPALVCRVQTRVLDLVGEIQAGAVTSIGRLIAELGDVLAELQDATRSLQNGNQEALASVLRSVTDSMQQVRDALAEGNLALAIEGAARVAKALNGLTGCPTP
jgi:hypothetical protein